MHRLKISKFANKISRNISFANRSNTAILPDWPDNIELLTIKSLAVSQTRNINIKKVELLSAVPGNYIPITYSQDETGLKITKMN